MGSKTQKSAAVPGVDSAQALGQAVSDGLKSLGALQVPVQEWTAMQADYLKNAAALWNQSLGTAEIGRAHV